MLAKLLGVLLLIVGGMIALGILAALVGTVIGIAVFLLKLAVPVLLVYVGYRLVTRDRRQAILSRAFLNARDFFLITRLTQIDGGNIIGTRCFGYWRM